MSDIRIVVVLTDANPELVAEFEKISPRARAERMRVLATLGQQLGTQRRAVGGTSISTTVPSGVNPVARTSTEKATATSKASPNAEQGTTLPPSREPQVQDAVGDSTANQSRPSNPRIGSKVARFAASLGNSQSN